MTQAQVAELIQRELDVNAIYARHLAARVSKKTPLQDAYELVKNKPAPFVKWVGGKRQLLQQFKDRGLYPPAAFDPIRNTYFEPFVGGGAVFFDLLPSKAVLSDSNAELVATYNIIKNDVEKLIASLRKHIYEKEYFLAMRAKGVHELSDLQIASRFIYLNRTCFNGLYRVNSKGQFNVPFGAYSNPRICDAENLRKVALALRNVRIEHENYDHVLKRAKKGDFIYFDPPYHPLSETSSFTSYTANGFTADDQIKLRDTFVALHERGCFVMLSNSSAPFINEIYSSVPVNSIEIHDVYAGRNINAVAKGRGRVAEVVVINY